MSAEDPISRLLKQVEPLSRKDPETWKRILRLVSIISKESKRNPKLVSLCLSLMEYILTKSLQLNLTQSPQDDKLLVVLANRAREINSEQYSPIISGIISFLDQQILSQEQDLISSGLQSLAEHIDDLLNEDL